MVLSVRALRRCTLLAISLLVWLLFTGCASRPYSYGDPVISSELAPRLVNDQQFYVGNPHPFLDASDWIWPGSLLAKLVLWNADIDSHEIDPDVVAAVAVYLARNNLDDVMVLVNTYRPGIQFKRLFTNREVGAFWRYTLGFLSVVNYTILPGRFFGGDHYNPYTNTISLFSNDLSVALHEAGHAKDFNRRRAKGWYAFSYSLPFVSLHHEAVASNDALSYLNDQCAFREQKDGYRTLHPAYATYVGGNFSFLLPEQYLGYFVTIPGHITGNIAAATKNPQKLERTLPCSGKSLFDIEIELNTPGLPARN